MKQLMLVAMRLLGRMSSKRSESVRNGLALSLAACALAAHSQTVQIDSVAASVQGGAEVVKIEFTQAPQTVPAGFVIQSPARIALDFPGVGSSMGRSTIDVNQGNVRTVNVVQSGERTRVVLNLKQATSYKTQIQGKTLLVTLEPVAVSSATSTPTQFSENRNADSLPLKDMDFRRTSEGAGRLTVDLVNNQVGVDIKQQGQNLVVEFLKSTLPEGLRRRMDVADFGTPVQQITTFQSGDKVRMIVEPKGSWEHSAYQSDNKFVLEFKNRTAERGKIDGATGYTGEKITLNFQNIEVRSLLQVIADFTNFNIITSDTVTGAVTLRLQDVPWDQALDIVLQAKNLSMKKNGNVLLVGPRDEMAAKEKQELESRLQLQGLEPLRTQSFQLNYAKASDIVTQITSRGAGLVGVGTGTTAAGALANAAANAASNMGSRVLSERGSAIAEPRTNQLFVTDIPSKLEAVQQLIAKLDIPVRQVLIEARIVEASDTFGRSLGVKLGGFDRRTTGYGIGDGQRIGWGTDYSNSLPTMATVNQLGNFVNLPSSGAGGFPAATFALSLFNSGANRVLALELSALEAEGKGKIVSSPRVITADQVKAIIEQGTELPYQSSTSSGATSVSFKKANLKLEVTPQITPDGSVILDVDVTKDSVGQATAAGLAIDTKHVKTQVLVENGGTVVIGGIFEITETDTVAKVPVVGDLPVVGNLFKNKSKVLNKSELLIFLTPRLIGERSALK
ncbi:MAG: hypothetical protein RLZZ271_318 [Pseudomonadota bacterium]|jgi:type IV pilus assembly protein PilQ